MGLTTESIQYPYSTGDLTTKIEYDGNGNPLYVGLAAPGSSPSSACWQIKKFTYDGSQNVTDVEFAEGSNAYDRVWDNRASYTYA
ncbi:hypothetical protein [Desulfatibacillum aliphaticivorans]|uniref:hypothetical protein n=1 Tax=Desulfatibacillum aliphaticivorans TaxID=218208 RepID=UPI001470F58E|nr:hypothetical protein [Desulfatibacillum aliphaticivorans]